MLAVKTMSRPAGPRRVARPEFSPRPLLPDRRGAAGTAAPGPAAPGPLTALFAAPAADPADAEWPPDPAPPHADSSRAAAMISPAVRGRSPGGVACGMPMRRHPACRRFPAAD